MRRWRLSATFFTGLYSVLCVFLLFQLRAFFVGETLWPLEALVLALAFPLMFLCVFAAYLAALFEARCLKRFWAVPGFALRRRF